MAIDDVTYQVQCIQTCLRQRDRETVEIMTRLCEVETVEVVRVLKPRPGCYTELMSRTSWLDRWTIDYRRGSESISVCLSQDRLSSSVLVAPC